MQGKLGGRDGGVGSGGVEEVLCEVVNFFRAAGEVGGKSGDWGREVIGSG